MPRSSLFVALVCTSCVQADVRPAVSVPELTGRVDLSIGLLDGPEQYAFGTVSGLAVGPEGQILVSDGERNVVRVFDQRGTFVRSFGREGEGPGEFKRPCCIAFGPDGALWVRDGGNRRYSALAWTESGFSEIKTVRMVHYDGWLYVPTTFTAAGDIIDVGHFSPDPGDFVLGRFTLSDGGAEVERIQVDEPSLEELGAVVKVVKVGGSQSRYYYVQPFGPSSLVAHGPRGTWATAVSSQYRVVLHSADGSITIQGPTALGPPLSEGERERGAQRIRDYVEQGGGNASDYPSVPDRKPQLAALYFDVGGHLWVEMSMPEGTTRRADMYDESGTLAGTRTWPWGVDLRTPAWVGPEYALGISRDSLGVERVVRVRFEG